MDILDRLIQENKSIDNKIMDIFHWTGDRYVFGNTPQTAIVLGFLKSMNINVSGRISPDKDSNYYSGYWKKRLKTIPVYEVCDVHLNKGSAILIAQPKIQQDVWVQYLRNMGFKNVFCCCWEHNSEMKKLVHDYVANTTEGIYSLD